MCAGKKRYKDEAAARFALDHVVEPSDGGSLRVYRCEYCSRWHLTSQPSR